MVAKTVPRSLKIKRIKLPDIDQLVQDNQEFPDLAPDWELDWDRHLYYRTVEFAKAVAVAVAVRAVVVVVAWIVRGVTVAPFVAPWMS